MKLNIFFCAVIMSISAQSLAQGIEFKLFHYNIKELNSKKISENDAQLNKVSHILRQFDFDILSLNEVQYDFPGVPDNTFQSEGQNLEKLKSALSLPSNWQTTFHPANTGMNARRNARGEYVLNPNSAGARELADQVNFGTVPGQYTSGAIHKFPKKKEVVLADLTWKEFNPAIDLSRFSTEDGHVLPEDIALFDKNFTDVLLDIQGRSVHLILLHTVPSFHFGNPKSPNYERNRDQLRFLEWYLTGETDIKVSLQAIKPIQGESFIAVGDFNADINDPSSLGGEVLKRFFAKTNLWIDQEQASFTNESSSFAPNPFRLMLDYIVASPDIQVVDGGIVHPDFERIELGCNGQDRTISRPNMVMKSYTLDEKSCKALVSKEYELFKEASDHYPIWARFQIK